MASLELQETLLPLLRVTWVELSRYFLSLSRLLNLQLLLIQHSLVHDLALRVVETLGQSRKFCSLYLEFLLTLAQLLLRLHLLNMCFCTCFHFCDF